MAIFLYNGVDHNYWSVSRGFVHYLRMGGDLNHHTNEALIQVQVRSSYTWSHLTCYVSNNTFNAACTMRSRINAVNGNQVVSVPAGTTGEFQDAVNSDSVVSGNLIDWSYDATAVGAGDQYFCSASSILDNGAASNAIIISGFGYGTNFGTIRYAGISGSTWENPNEASGQYTFRTAATLSRMRVYVVDNTLNAAATLRLRVNGANGNQSISVPAATTGAFEDAVNSDIIAAGNQIASQIDATAATSGYLTTDEWQYRSDSIARQTVVGHLRADINYSICGVNYQGLEGYTNYAIWNETHARNRALCSFTARNAFIRIEANSLDGATVWTLRRNGADTPLAVTVGAGLTGVFENLVNTAAFVAADFINWELDTSASSAGSIRAMYSGFEQGPAGGPTPGGLADKSATMSNKMVGVGLI